MPDLNNDLPAVIGCDIDRKNNKITHQGNQLKNKIENQPTSREKSQQKQQNCIPQFNFPPVATNSVLVRQRAQAPTYLVASALEVGASLPLMPDAQLLIGNQQYNCLASNKLTLADNKFTIQYQPETKNQALQANQRRRSEAISIVRPVISTSESRCDPSREAGKESSVIGDFLEMEMDMKTARHLEEHRETIISQPDYSHRSIDEGTLIFRQNQLEIDRQIKSQHKFILRKFEERRMNLLIIQSIWNQRNFKRAIEKLLDMYQEGLVFAEDEMHIKTLTCGLSSTNAPLVVDIIGIMVLRPKLWSLEICQLLLPIIVNDLLIHTKVQQYENYLEVGLKAVKLILNNFSPLIITTLNNGNVGAQDLHVRCFIGVNLSGEERLVRCIKCARSLKEAKKVLSKIEQNKLSVRLKTMCRETEQSLGCFEETMKQQNYLQCQQPTQILRRPRVASIA